MACRLGGLEASAHPTTLGLSASPYTHEGGFLARSSIFTDNQGGYFGAILVIPNDFKKCSRNVCFCGLGHCKSRFQVVAAFLLAQVLLAARGQATYKVRLTPGFFDEVGRPCAVDNSWLPLLQLEPALLKKMARGKVPYYHRGVKVPAASCLQHSVCHSNKRYFTLNVPTLWVWALRMFWRYSGDSGWTL